MEGSIISTVVWTRRKLAGIWIALIAVSIGVVLIIVGTIAMFTEQECIERFGTCEYISIPVTAWLTLLGGVVVLVSSLAACIVMWSNWRA